MRVQAALAMLAVPAVCGAQQTLAERYAPLALTAPEPHEAARELRDATVHPDFVDLYGVDPQRGEYWLGPDGAPLRTQQVPRFLHPHHDGPFGFDDFLVLGDHPTVTFERYDWDDDEQGTKWRRETWRRAATRDVSGHLVSVFHPRWPADLLRRKLRRSWWGVDEPVIFWGNLLVPGPDGGSRRVTLSVVPPNIPPSPVIRINDRVQYASHVVNIRDPDSGAGGEETLNQWGIVRQFYEYFEDEYEVVAVVTDDHLLSWWGGAHGTVRNDIRGIGMRVFDRSGELGSAGVLQAVETWDGGRGWQGWSGVLHEQGHQYGDFTKAWESMRPPLVRAGHNPDGHTPLLYPGAVAYGAVLYGNRRVGRVRGQQDKFQIEATLPLFTYHPLTLYRMGLLPASEVPDMLVFHDQGQFNPTSNASPYPGTPVTGGTTLVTVNDLMAADGVRRGPVVREIRRAMVWVSRERLVPKEHMDVLNYFARRLEATSGTTSYDRYPSFAEATGGRAKMTTGIRPRRGRAAASSGPDDGRCAKVPTAAFPGVKLDRELGGCLQSGDTIRVSGLLTLDDRDDYDTVCVRFRRYPDVSPDVSRIFECAPLDGGNRFTLEASLTRPGGYLMEVSAWWPGAGWQFALTNYTGAIEVLPRR